MPRVKEVLETHDWSAATADDGPEDDLEEALLGFDGERGSGFGMEVNELEREMLGLRMAIEQRGGDGESNGEEDEEEENKVESMETLIMRMQSLRGMSILRSHLSSLVLTGQIWGLSYQTANAGSLRRRLYKI